MLHLQSRILLITEYMKYWRWGVPQLVKCLQHRQEDLGLELQQPGAVAPNPGAREIDSGSLECISQLT